MNTKVDEPLLAGALANIPKILRSKLIETYLELKRNSLEAKYETSGLNAGKFCEVLLRILQNEVTGTHLALKTPVGNMADECRKIITAQNKAAPESIKIILPRALIFLYTMRNKRGIGHVGGDIDANLIDNATIVRIADWVICELIRIYHKMPIEEAQDLIDGISYKALPIIWEISGKKRVLKDGLKSKQKALLLLYSTNEGVVLSEDLCSWIEYNPSMFARRVLNDLHKDRLIEYDKESELVYLSPKGAKFVEDNLLS